MNCRIWFAVICGIVCFSLSLCGDVFGNKSSVNIQAPGEAPKGSDVVLRVTVIHNDNSPLHYTDWVFVTVNGKEVVRWTYSAFQRPDSETFTKEVTLKATETLDIKAEANCNLHGSAGPATSRVSVKD